MIKFEFNGKKISVDVEDSTPLLWVIREQLGITSTKFGCGKALCGACTVHLNGDAIRSCVTPVSAVQGTKIATLEGLESKLRESLQEVWAEENVPQCGYCQTGQLMSAAALFEKNPTPNDGEIIQAMDGNICRCGTYPRIKKAMKRLSEKSNG